MRAWAVTILAFSLALPAYAQNAEAIIPRAMNNLAHEYAICAAYFTMVGVAAENSDDSELAGKYAEAAASAMQNAELAGTEAQLLPETHVARFNMAFDEMSERIGMNTSNISILFADHAELCLSSMNEMSARMEHFIEAEFEKTFGYPMPVEE